MTLVNDVYTPDLDGQALIDELYLACVHSLRWDSILNLLETKSREFAIEALICNMAWHKTEYIFFRKMYICLFGWGLLPYVTYRRDHPPQGDWSPAFGWSAEEANVRYQIVCDMLIEASKAELLRD